MPSQAPPPPASYAREVLRLLRPHQWAKNGLLLLPLFLAHELTDPGKLGRALLGVVGFSLLASAVYVINDWRDIDADRRHPDKCRRPLARGSVPPSHALPLAAVLAAAALTGAHLWTSSAFFGILLTYLVANVLYSFGLKRVPILDVLLLTCMYLFRIHGGGAAAGVPVTGWLTLFSLWFFLSIAFGKRYQELREARADGVEADAKVRGYQVGDTEAVGVLGLCAGVAAVFVLIRYVRGEQASELYQSSELLWPACLPVLYWIGRFWRLNFKGRMRHDPVLFALKDPTSYVAAALTAAIVLAARHIVL